MTLLDGAMQEVPEHLEGTFADGVELFDDLSSDLRNLRRKFNDLVKTPHSDRLGGDAAMLFGTLRNYIAHARPYAVCCECHGHATLQKVGELAACRACRGAGWLTEREWKALKS